MTTKERGYIGERDGKFYLKIELSRDDATGKRRFHYSRHATRDEAVARRAEVLNAIKEGSHVRRTRERVSAWLDTWLTTYAKHNLTPASLGHYENQLRHVKRHIGGMVLQDVKPTTVDTLWATLLAGYEYEGRTIKLSRSSVTLARVVLKRAFDQAVKSERLLRNPVDTSNVPKRDPAADQRDVEADGEKAFTREEVGRLLHGLRGTELFAPVLLAAGTGLRGQEVCGLRWGDVDLDPARAMGMIRVRTAIEIQRKGVIRVKGPKTESSRRDVPVAGDIVQELAQHRAKCAEVGLAFGLQLDGTWFVVPASPDKPTEPRSPRTQSAHFARAARALGITRPTFHRLRHYHATMLLEDGERVEVVAERLGHASVATTIEIYASVLRAAKEKAAATAGKGSDAALRFEPKPGTVTALRGKRAS